jgi:GT2 family glycosyltransferase
VKAADAQPFCSVVVPTRDRPRQLDQCLGALARLDYPAECFEVVVVDDGGTAPVAGTVSRFSDELDVKVFRQQRKGPGGARNAGAARARGTYLAFTDDDCRPAQNWLGLLVARNESAEGAGGAGGHTLNALSDNPYSTTAQLVIDIGYAWNNRDPDDARFFTTNNMVVPADVFAAIGGFDEQLTTSEDRDFCDRLRAAGYRLLYTPDAIVHHFHDLSMRTFWRQQFAYGRGALRFHRRHARRWNQHVRVEPEFYWQVFSHPFRHWRGLDSIRLAALLQLWNLANVAGFAAEWWSRTDENPRACSHEPLR